jgi:hypothetical protein
MRQSQGTSGWRWLTTRRWPTWRWPRPHAHSIRGGNLRRALTTPHLHRPSRRRRTSPHACHEPPRIITAGRPSRATTVCGPHTIFQTTPTRQLHLRQFRPPARPSVHLRSLGPARSPPRPPAMTSSTPGSTADHVSGGCATRGNAWRIFLGRRPHAQAGLSV